MTGCDRCGAQALPAEAACPVCGLALRVGAAAGRSQPEIPVRRYGTVPLPPMELLAPADAGVVSLPALALGALGMALIVSGVGYWLW